MRLTSIIILLTLLTACAARFPDPQLDAATVASPDGANIFKRTLNTHGGEKIDQLNDVNLAISGQWKRLITRIQPLVSDYRFRVDSQERLFLSDGGYVAFYTGPSGTKKVVRTLESLEVYYNGERSKDPEVLSSTALTADAFHLFLLGPLSLVKWQNDFVRLADIRENGQNFHRIYLERKPGFGYSKSDQVVLWVNQETGRTFRVQITLQGHSTTQGAHVEVDYLDYIKEGDYLFPSRFFERVNAPIAIDAHQWSLTGLDINRSVTLEKYSGADSEFIIASPAKPLGNN